jgi:hypothetical protein
MALRPRYRSQTQGEEHMSIEAMKEALSALENVRQHDTGDLYGLDDEITALRQAIVQYEPDQGKIQQLEEKCEELYSDKERWFRLAELHCHTIERLKSAMRSAMAMLDQDEPLPASAFSELLLALNPEIDNRKKNES